MWSNEIESKLIFDCSIVDADGISSCVSFDSPRSFKNFLREGWMGDVENIGSLDPKKTS